MEIFTSEWQSTGGHFEPRLICSQRSEPYLDSSEKENTEWEHTKIDACKTLRYPYFLSLPDLQKGPLPSS